MSLPIVLALVSFKSMPSAYERGDRSMTVLLYLMHAKRIVQQYLSYLATAP